MASKSIVSIAVGICIVCILGIAVSLHIYRENRAADAVLDRADSLLTAGEADAAMSLLDSIRAEAMGYRRSRHYRYRLLEADAMNKTYRPFTTDSILKEVARYYDGCRGTPTKRLRARYLLGCAYRDMKEAPLALIAWEDAVAAADTTETDCDYATLYRIYGQMADIYFRQYLFDKQLEAQNQFCKYALAAGDTANYIRGLIKRNDAYMNLNDTVSIWKNVEDVRKECKRLGKENMSARVYPTPIDMALDASNYSHAKKMMQIFEREFGMIDSTGNIERTAERYYFNKGRYYMGVGELDSAEYQFRKLLSTNRYNRDAYYGLMYIYLNKRQCDSLIHYSECYTYALAEYLEDNRTDAVAQAQGMYDYHRHQQLALAEQNRSKMLQTTLLLSSLVFVIVILSVFIWYRKKRAKTMVFIQQMMKDAMRTRRELDEAKDEMAVLKANLHSNAETDVLLKKKEEEIHQLEIKLHEYEKTFDKLKEVEKDSAFKKCEIVSRFRDMTKPTVVVIDGHRSIIPTSVPSDHDWAELEDATMQMQPLFYTRISEKGLLTRQEFQVCLLIGLGFNTKDTATLLNTHSSRVSKVKGLVNEKLFGDNAPNALVNNLRNIQKGQNGA